MKKLAYAFLAISTISITSCVPNNKLTKQQKNDLENTYTTLQNDLTGADVSFSKDRVVVVLSEAALFAINSAEINEAYKPTLAKMAAVLNRYPKTNVLITGYTDNTGTDAINNDLSKRRAEAARVFLTENKVEDARLYTWGMGSKDPIADNAAEEGRKRNRRVQFVILYNYNAGK